MYIHVSLLNIMIFRSFHIKEEAPSVPHFYTEQCRKVSAEAKHLIISGRATDYYLAKILSEQAGNTVTEIPQSWQVPLRKETKRPLEKGEKERLLPISFFPSRATGSVLDCFFCQTFLSFYCVLIYNRHCSPHTEDTTLVFLRVKMRQLHCNRGQQALHHFLFQF